MQDEGSEKEAMEPKGTRPAAISGETKSPFILRELRHYRLFTSECVESCEELDFVIFRNHYEKQIYPACIKSTKLSPCVAD